MKEKDSEINSIKVSNDDIRKQKSIGEYKTIDEYKSYSTQLRVFEFAPKKQIAQSKPKSKLKTLLTTFLVGVVSLTTLILPMNNLDKDIIQNYSIEAYDEGIFYFFEFAEEKDYSNLKINVYNDFVCYTEDVEDNVIENFIEDLKPNLKYTISITNGGTTIFKKDVVTKSLRQTSDNHNW